MRITAHHPRQERAPAIDTARQSRRFELGGNCTRIAAARVLDVVVGIAYNEFRTVARQRKELTLEDGRRAVGGAGEVGCGLPQRFGLDLTGR